MDTTTLAERKTYELRARILALLDMDRNQMTTNEFSTWQSELDAIRAEILNRA